MLIRHVRAERRRRNWLALSSLLALPLGCGTSPSSHDDAGAIETGAPDAPRSDAHPSTGDGGAADTGTSPSDGGTPPSDAGTPPSDGGASSGPPCASPGACGFPDETTTGAPPGTHLMPVTGQSIELRDDGATIDGVEVMGSYDVYANNVTIQNCVIHSTNWWGVNLRQGYTNLRVLHCTITGVAGAGPDNGGEDYGVSNMGDGAIEVAYNNISQFGAGISMGHGNIHDNYVHDNQPFMPIGADYYVHSDGIISGGMDTLGMVIRHNTFLNPLTTELGASAAIGLFYDDGPVSNTTVDNNFAAGGSYVIYPGGGASSSNIHITNNYISTMYWSGGGVNGADATSYWHEGGGNVWSGNIWADGPHAGATVDP